MGVEPCRSNQDVCEFALGHLAGHDDLERPLAQGEFGEVVAVVAQVVGSAGRRAGSTASRVPLAGRSCGLGSLQPSSSPRSDAGLRRCRQSAPSLQGAMRCNSAPSRSNSCEQSEGCASQELGIADTSSSCSARSRQIGLPSLVLNATTDSTLLPLSGIPASSRSTPWNC